MARALSRVQNELLSCSEKTVGGFHSELLQEVFREVSNI